MGHSPLALPCRAQPTNQTSVCYISCFFDTLLGSGSGEWVKYLVVHSRRIRPPGQDVKDRRPIGTTCPIQRTHETYARCNVNARCCFCGNLGEPLAALWLVRFRAQLPCQATAQCCSIGDARPCTVAINRLQYDTDCRTFDGCSRVATCCALLRHVVTCCALLHHVGDVAAAVLCCNIMYC